MEDTYITGSSTKLSEKLKSLRIKSYLSQDDLADYLGTSRQIISLWELGEALPSVLNIVSLAELYHVSIDDLMDDTVDLSEMPEPPQKRMRRQRHRKLAMFAVMILSVLCLLAGSYFIYLAIDRSITVRGPYEEENVQFREYFDLIDLE